MDAGIATEENIHLLVRRGMAYHCVVRQGFEQYGADYEQGQAFEHKTTNGYACKVWLTVRQHEFIVDEQPRTDWLIFVKSEANAIKENGIVEQQKERFKKGLTQIRASLSKLRGHKSKAQVHQRIGRSKPGTSGPTRPSSCNLKTTEPTSPISPGSMTRPGKNTTAPTSFAPPKKWRMPRLPGRSTTDLLRRVTQRTR